MIVQGENIALGRCPRGRLKPDAERGDIAKLFQQLGHGD
jgi:hypothetical protein